MQVESSENVEHHVGWYVITFREFNRQLWTYQGASRVTVRVSRRWLRNKPMCSAPTAKSATTGMPIKTCRERVAESLVVVNTNGFVYRAWRYCENHGGMLKMELDFAKFLERHDGKETVDPLHVLQCERVVRDR